MRILKVVVRCIKGIKEIDWDLSESHLWIVGGRNGQGKTSAIQAIKMALCSKKGLGKDEWPVNVLRDGEDEGEAVLTLSGDPSVGEYSELTVELKATRAANGNVKEQLTIYESTGEKASSPVELLHELYHTRAFDPLEFSRLDRNGQREVVAKLAGLDLTKYREEYEKTFKLRTKANAEVKRLKGFFDTLPKHPDAPDAKIDTGQLAEELKAAQEHNSVVADMAFKHEDAKAKLTGKRKLVDELKVKLAIAEDEAGQLAKTVCDLADQASSHKPVETEPIVEKMSSASRINDLWQDNFAKEKAKAEWKESSGAADTLTASLEAMKSLVDKKIAEAAFPVPGMSISRDQVLLNGVPLQDCCTSDQIITSARIGIAQKPTLRLMIIRNGGELDNNALDGLEELMREEDFQLIVEMVTRNEMDDERCAVVMVDGEDGKVKS